MATALVFSAAAAAGAGEVPPDTLSPGTAPPISSLLSKRGEGAQVVMRGHVQEASAGEYVVVGEGGSVRVRIPPALLKGGLVIVPGTHIEVRGTVRATPVRGFQLDAREVVVLRAADGPAGTGDVHIK